MSTLSSFGQRLDLILDQEDENAIVAVSGAFVGEIQVRRTQGSPGANSSELLFTLTGPDVFTLEGRRNVEYSFVMTEYVTGTASFSFIKNPLVGSIGTGSGLQGPAGPQGPIGPAGPQGQQGIQGPQGIPGSAAGSINASDVVVAPGGGLTSTDGQGVFQDLSNRLLDIEPFFDIALGVVKLPNYLNANLPDPVASGSGAIAHSTDLNRPVYSNGTQWFDFNNVPITTVVTGFGPQTGFAVGIGQTDTSLASIDSAVLAAQAAFEQELENLHNARAATNTDVTIQAANPGFVTLTGKTTTDLNNALGGGNRRLFLTAAGGDYNWSGTLPDFDDIELVGLVDAGTPCVIIGGTPKNRGQVRFRIRGQGGRAEGIEFKDGALCFSFTGAPAGIIPRMHVDFCKFTNVGNSVHCEVGGAFGNINAGAGVADVRVDNCIIDDVSHGINMRCGPGYGEQNPIPPGQSPDFQVGAFRARETIVRNHDNMGICCHFDTRGGDLASVFWPGIAAGSTMLVDRCVVTRRTLSNLPGFPVNGTACQTSHYKDSYFTETISNPNGLDDDVYSKSDTCLIEGCVIWNTGTSRNFQGQVGAKGEGNPGSLPLNSFTVNNCLIGHDDTVDISRCFFAQRSNIFLNANTWVIATGSNGEGGGISQQGGGSGYDTMTSTGNLYRVFGGFAASAAVQVSANVSDWTFNNDTFETLRPGPHTLVRFRDASGFQNTRPALNGCTFRKLPGAGPTAPITIAVTGDILNPVVNGCVFDIGTDTAVIITGNAINGALTWTNNTSVGGPPGTFNGTTSVVNTFGPGGGNDFT